jgi:hypothetical protein
MFGGSSATNFQSTGPDHPIAANGLLAPLVTMTCRLLLRRVASRGVLPRERFKPLTRNGPNEPVDFIAPW